MKILDNCCSESILDTLKDISSKAPNWNLNWPAGDKFLIEDKFLKLDIIQDGHIIHPLLAGLSLGLLLQIYEVSDKETFVPNILFCSISIKDKHRKDNIHTDHTEDENSRKLIKIMGLLNSDWQEEWGGNFFYNGESNYVKPTSFCIFDPKKPHSSDEIFTDKKRFVIDFSVLTKPTE